MEMRVNVPEELNWLLRRYALEYRKGSREKATLFILENFLKQIYKNESN